MKDKLLDKLSEAIHVMDQSAAQNRDAGEDERAEADMKLADSFAGFANAVRPMLQRIEKRIERNQERKEQGLPPLTIKEHLTLEQEDAHGTDL